jgi:hypothetical protein
VLPSRRSTRQSTVSSSTSTSTHAHVVVDLQGQQ